jgi:hypothetical protein
MNREFGFQYHVNDGTHRRRIFGFDTVQLDQHEVQYYIHPDSLLLLKPKMGDVIKQWDDPNHHLIYDIGERSGKPVYFLCDTSYNFFESIERITQRDGKPFF